MKKGHILCIAAFSLGIAACGRDAPESAAGADTDPADAAFVQARAVAGNPAAETAAQEITADYMREIIVEISDDRYEGRGPTGCGRRNHHSHDAVGGVSVPGGADVLDRRAVRAAGRRRTA